MKWNECAKANQSKQMNGQKKRKENGWFKILNTERYNEYIVHLMLWIMKWSLSWNWKWAHIIYLIKYTLFPCMFNGRLNKAISVVWSSLNVLHICNVQCINIYAKPIGTIYCCKLLAMRLGIRIPLGSGIGDRHPWV